MVMSNELGLTTANILVCPADPLRYPATNWSRLLPVNVSYQLRSGPTLSEFTPKEVLVRCPIHQHVVFGDGSVQANSSESIVINSARSDTPAKAGAGQRSPDGAEPRKSRDNVMDDLRQIEGAKILWALENKKPDGYVPTESDIEGIGAFLRTGKLPVHPPGGHYIIGPIGGPAKSTLYGQLNW